MRTTTIAVALSLFAGALLAASDDGTVVSRKAFEPPSWEAASASSDVGKYATRAEYGKSAADVRYILQRVVYRSDGLDVVAYAYIPRKSGAVLPAVVFNRGSLGHGEIAPELLTLFHRLASAGFIVVAPLYRAGSAAGAGGSDAMRAIELHDLLNIVPVVSAVGGDPANVFLYGESRGGMMVFQAVRDGFPARAAATWGAFTNLATILADPQWKGMVKEIWPDFDVHREEIIARSSAVRWVNKLTLPLLLMQGGADRSVNPMQSLSLAESMQDQGNEYSLIIFAGDDHLLSAHREERDRQAIAWFREHLRK